MPINITLIDLDIRIADLREHLADIEAQLVADPESEIAADSLAVFHRKLNAAIKARRQRVAA